MQKYIPLNCCIDHLQYKHYLNDAGYAVKSDQIETPGGLIKTCVSKRSIEEKLTRMGS